MFKKLRKRIESKRNSNELFWKTLVSTKDFLWKLSININFFKLIKMKYQELPVPPSTEYCSRCRKHTSFYFIKQEKKLHKPILFGLIKISKKTNICHFQCETCGNKIQAKILKQYFWKKSKLDENNYNTLIETGVYRGYSVDMIKNNYKTIHSIELSKKWYRFCKKKFKSYPNIHIHHGDSKYKLPEILDKVHKPVIVFLDAHYSGGSTVKPSEDNDTVLLDELRYLKNRKYDDIIIIDDTNYLGAFGGKEPPIKPLDNVVYPEFHYNWSNTTKDKVLQLMKPQYSMMENKDSLYVNGKIQQFIWYPIKKQN